jgi:HD-GYP domain-containing protein (c-di-GMP phosphodiesterase class II)
MHSSDDRIIYQSHAEIGAQMLRQLKTVPDDIALIVLEHHELSDGTGFPRGLKDFQISPLARVVSLANAFSEIVMEETGTLGPQTAHRALEMLEFKKAQQFNKDAMRALRRLVKGISSQAA